jgi:hypothetical protein
MFLSEWREFPSGPCLAEKKNLMTARVSMLLKSRTSLTCFQACFLPDRTKDLLAPRYQVLKRILIKITKVLVFMVLKLPITIFSRFSTDISTFRKVINKN